MFSDILGKQRSGKQNKQNNLLGIGLMHRNSGKQKTQDKLDSSGVKNAVVFAQALPSPKL